jgi:hypothetical protein
VDGDPIVAGSAHKHGIVDDDILHPFNNPIRIEDLDEELFMLIGADRAGNLLEIGVVPSSDVPVIVHAMEARPTYLR